MKSFKEFSTLKVEGSMLDVGDGDAIILVLEKENKKILILIDGGDSTYANRVCNEVKIKCLELEKRGPDLIICTHYDSDHIAGVIDIIKYFGSQIGMVWVHKPADLIQESFEPISQFLDHLYSGTTLTEQANFLRQIQLINHDKNGQFISLLESIKQVKTLFELITEMGILYKEPFQGECIYPGWPEIVILGPSRTYYDSIFNRDSFYQLLSEEHSINLMEGQTARRFSVSDPCSSLKRNPSTSCTNLVSLILRIDAGLNKLLFTGDAGIKSFEAAVNYPLSIKDMTFLKIPHHGSSNNITRELINLINPIIAFNSGDTYEDPAVINCLRSKKGRIVKTTKKGRDLQFTF